MIRKLRERFRRDDGMTTAEYAVGIIAAVALAVVTSPAVATALTTIVKDALAARR